MKRSGRSEVGEVGKVKWVKCCKMIILQQCYVHVSAKLR